METPLKEVTQGEFDAALHRAMSAALIDAAPDSVRRVVDAFRGSIEAHRFTSLAQVNRWLKQQYIELETGRDRSPLNFIFQLLRHTASCPIFLHGCNAVGEPHQ